MTEVQTRSEASGLRYFASVTDAMEAAEHDTTIWKISFSLGEERIRLVKQILYTSTNLPIVWWTYQPILDEFIAETF